MSKNINEVYDVTMDAVNDTLSRFKAFYATHSVKDNLNYNAHMAEHTDVSDRQWPRIR